MATFSTRISCSRTLDSHRVSAVFHLAAQTIVGTAAASPAPTFETNVRGTWTLLEACREHGVERVVVASSDKAYGAHERASLPRGLRAAADRAV